MDKVARLLDDGLYRLVRDAADLHAILLEEIAAIANGAKEHLSLLYLPRKQQGRNEVAGGESPRTLQEDALQAYFFCRLNDRLGRVLDPGVRVIFINREALAAKDQRLDLKVQAPTITGSTPTVVVELKWASNTDVSTSLKEQLGKEYLVGGSLTHGIYLVGWNKRGRWKDADTEGPQDVDSLHDWLEAFHRQANHFASAHPDIVIEPVVVDLVWPPPK